MNDDKAVRELHRLWKSKGLMPVERGNQTSTERAAADFHRLHAALLWIIDEASPQADDLPQRMRDIREFASAALTGCTR